MTFWLSDVLILFYSYDILILCFFVTLAFLTFWLSDFAALNFRLQKSIAPCTPKTQYFSAVNLNFIPVLFRPFSSIQLCSWWNVHKKPPSRVALTGQWLLKTVEKCLKCFNQDFRNLGLFFKDLGSFIAWQQFDFHGKFDIF